MTKHPKLHKLTQDFPLVWGCAGNTRVAERFDSYMRANAPKSWSDIEGDVRHQVAELNGAEREIIKIAGVEWTGDHGLTCLIAGSLKGTLGIWEIDNNGQPDPYIADGFCAIGGAALHAELIYKALSGAHMEPIDKLRLIYDTLIEGLRTIGHPVDIWKVTCGGITRLQGRCGDNEETAPATTTD